MVRTLEDASDDLSDPFMSASVILTFAVPIECHINLFVDYMIN